uniref:Late endosomal/lysosomal adaptor and MAPK and MTOR activator 5 n=1 Tax=Trieres chinensis TaxID=1514140 RepID=A0A7S2AAI1_TRICV|mmetsp:Transcript_9557/g.20244  ORF Transcript_9557/g.20244 Transcript_9557/m.20244 type:complete len:120 (+) Transcript_9557:177-536(+)|eukprot:CAMPEP_0183308912 /NCGR_PEP_ID=MMETSP0160_2-20130417/22950_1 /TAXON_ID=2839 ORGANISM="Odontella Sinensis, Strain Grunow 1884" /NCGR_SAMPLE_ID=MMETSP0160_2 /ASSEMBLY_ACC=CAM_ASM_000250 /LENGTH=119 /DNA_ID=CAMNT_0025472829 /DNA_START=143 /DNA_END=502 /DNA_ORIENTATION=-
MSAVGRDKTQAATSGVDAILSDRPASGVLCNDPSGLCLGSRGSVDVSKSGAYTSIVRLASQLCGVDAPLVSIETDKASTLVKEYNGYVVALRTPVTVSKEEINRDGAAPQEGGSAEVQE